MHGKIKKVFFRVIHYAIMVMITVLMLMPIRPWTSFVHEFTINYCIIDFVISSDFIKLIHKMGCFSTENTILLQPDYITSGWYPLL